MGSRILCLRGSRAPATQHKSGQVSEPMYPLVLLPDADEIGRLLQAPGRERIPVCRYSYYRGKPNVASYLTATREAVICMMIRGDVTHEQANEINACLDEVSRIYPVHFQDIVEEVLGESVNPLHPRGWHIARWHRLV